MKAPPSAAKQPPKPPAAPLPNAVTLKLGENLTKFRIAADISQEELAHDAEIERSRISKMENGHINATVMTLATLCDCLNITLPQLFDGVTATLPPTSRGGVPRRENQARHDKPAEKGSRHSRLR
ncbi:helix-turn-helix transcriptional regulator [Flavobacterium sp.]|uniref:helix-turn-helix domain-containing protein n=1 Tax=Flavobacterium sp. TaxID=239 RepID=UPI003264AF13